MAETTPVTVLTGATAAGKTTVAAHWLRLPDLAGAEILTTSVGATGQAHRPGLPPGQFNPGCPCCGVASDLARGLRAFLPRARRGEISRIIIETRGQADPLAVVDALLGDPVFTGTYRLAGVVAVVDAVQGLESLDGQPVARRQIERADLIVVNKVDLGVTAGLRACLSRLNPSVPLAYVAWGEVAAAFVMGCE